ncbi:MAG: DUF2017 family protein [Ilumatobacteraceae bacterium]|nr:DUF2017 family protein [Ilumatobacteraceae bacterium]
MARPFTPPIKQGRQGWQINLGQDERDLIIRLMNELKALLTEADEDEASPLLARLFPAVYPDDAEKEAEYQRLMREELVTSRVAAIDSVIETLGPDGPKHLDEGQTMAFMQSVNAVRLVLGAMLDISDDDDADEADDADTPEHHLYNFLSWLLEWTVRSMSA